MSVPLKSMGTGTTPAVSSPTSSDTDKKAEVTETDKKPIHHWWDIFAFKKNKVADAPKEAKDGKDSKDPKEMKDTTKEVKETKAVSKDEPKPKEGPTKETESTSTPSKHPVLEEAQQQAHETIQKLERMDQEATLMAEGASSDPRDEQIERYFQCFMEPNGELPMELNYDMSDHLTFITPDLFYLKGTEPIQLDKEGNPVQDSALIPLIITRKPIDDGWEKDMWNLKEEALSINEHFFDTIASIRDPVVIVHPGMKDVLDEYLGRIYNNPDSDPEVRNQYRSELRLFVEQVANNIYVNPHHACTDDLPDLSRFSLMEIGLRKSGALLETYNMQYNIFRKNQTAIRKVCKCGMTTYDGKRAPTAMSQFELLLYHLLDNKGPEAAKSVAQAILEDKDTYEMYSKYFNMLHVVIAYCSANIALRDLMVVEEANEVQHADYLQVRSVIQSFEDRRHRTEVTLFASRIRDETRSMLDAHLNVLFYSVFDAVASKNKIQSLETTLKARLTSLDAKLEQERKDLLKSHENQLDSMRKAPEFSFDSQTQEDLAAMRATLESERKEMSESQKATMDEMNTAHASRNKIIEAKYTDTVKASQRMLDDDLESIVAAEQMIASREAVEAKSETTAAILTQSMQKRERELLESRRAKAKTLHQKRITEAELESQTAREDSDNILADGLHVLSLELQEHEASLQDQHQQLVEKEKRQKEEQNTLKLSIASRERKLFAAYEDQLEKVQARADQLKKDLRNTLMEEREQEATLLRAAKAQLSDKAFTEAIKPSFAAWESFVAEMVSVVTTCPRFTALPESLARTHREEKEIEEGLRPYLRSYMDDWKATQTSVLSKEIESMLQKLNDKGN